VAYGGYNNGYPAAIQAPGSTYSSYAVGYGQQPVSPLPPPPPPPPPIVPPGEPGAVYLPSVGIRLPSPVWTFAVGAWQKLPTRELSRASERSVTWRLIGNHEASFTIAGEEPTAVAEASAIEEMITDLWIMWNGQPLFRGRFGASSDSGDSASVSSTFAAADYRALLDRRQLWEGDTVSYLNQDQSAIAWGLISTAQGKPAGDLGIIQGQGRTTGVLRDRTDYAPGDSITHDLDLLSQVQNGFDYDITPVSKSTALHFDVFYPARGTDRGVVLDFAGLVAKFDRQVDPTAFMNAVRGTGGNPLLPNGTQDTTKTLHSLIVSTTLSTDPAGRWEGEYSEGSITLQTTLDAKTYQAMRDGMFVQPSYTLTLKPGAWEGPNHIWLGDQVTLSIHAGRLNVTESLRVVGIGLTLDQNDTETITVTLGSPPPFLRRLQRVIDKRLQALERR
jgi:hypothetical protein